MKKSFLVLGLACVAFANTMYLNKNVDIKVDGKVIANASLLSPVKVLSQNGDVFKVELVGYVNDNYQEELVKSFTQNENYASFHDDKDNATFKGDKNPYIKMLEKAEDDYGEVWHKASISFDVKKEDLIKSAEVVYKDARNLYEQTCSACHRLHDTNSYTTNQWPSNVESMISTGYVDLDKKDKMMIIKYLQQNSKDAK